MIVAARGADGAMLELFDHGGSSPACRTDQQPAVRVARPAPDATRPPWQRRRQRRSQRQTTAQAEPWRDLASGRATPPPDAPDAETPAAQAPRAAAGEITPRCVTSCARKAEREARLPARGVPIRSRRRARCRWTRSRTRSTAPDAVATGGRKGCLCGACGRPPGARPVSPISTRSTRPARHRRSIECRCRRLGYRHARHGAASTAGIADRVLAWPSRWRRVGAGLYGNAERIAALAPGCRLFWTAMSRR